jgi:hypothetical protein
MAREGYLILDSDLHLMEPEDLWSPSWISRTGRICHVSSMKGAGNQARALLTKPTPTSYLGWKCKG